MKGFLRKQNLELVNNTELITTIICKITLLDGELYKQSKIQKFL